MGNPIIKGGQGKSAQQVEEQASGLAKVFVWCLILALALAVWAGIYEVVAC